MPFKSKAQQRFLFAKKPKVAQEFAAKTPNFNALPEHVASTGKKPMSVSGFKKSWGKMKDCGY